MMINDANGNICEKDPLVHKELSDAMDKLIG